MTDETKPDQPDQSQVNDARTNAESQSVEDSSNVTSEHSQPETPPVESRLPEKFLADDPDFFDRRVGRSGSRRVLIPDGRGGMQSVDELIVKVEHQGEMIELVALPAHERRRRQRIVNFVSVVIGALFMLIFFWLFF